MARDSELFAGAETRIFTNPWPALIAGGILTVGASLWYLVTGHAAPPLAFLGLTISGIGISIRPRSSLVLGAAALSGVFAWCGLQWNEKAGGMNWDSGRALVAVMTAVALLAMVLVLVPRLVRRVVISLLILFHFGGILTAVTSVPPNPWLSSMAWTFIYRPYLEFFYLGNAYHFYSPDPGPGTQVWFYVQFEDGQESEYVVADRDESPLKHEYQRRISLAESVNQRFIPRFSPAEWKWLSERRVTAGLVDGINMHPDISLEQQYRPITPWYSKPMLQTYVRYVARNSPHPTGAEKKVAGVKVYLVVHRILDPGEIAAKVDPDNPWLFAPYYLGEFDALGALKDPNDPYLYWLIPIVKKPIPVLRASRAAFGLQPKNRVEGQPEEVVADFLEIHRRLKTGRFDNPRVDIPGGAN